MTLFSVKTMYRMCHYADFSLQIMGISFGNHGNQFWESALLNSFLMVFGKKNAIDNVKIKLLLINFLLTYFGSII